MDSSNHQETKLTSAQIAMAANIHFVDCYCNVAQSGARCSSERSNAFNTPATCMRYSDSPKLNFTLRR